MTAFLDVRDLRVQFPTDDGIVHAVDGLSFTLERGRTLGIVGESGSGKTVTGLSLLIAVGLTTTMSRTSPSPGRSMMSRPSRPST